jgi:endonuclease YncB( thermonuclease family)
MFNPGRMLRVVTTIGLLAALLGVPFGLARGAAQSQGLISCYGTVSKVDDGDTVNVHLTSDCPGGEKGHLIVVRDAGIQATEISHRGSKPECWSEHAQRFVRALIPVGTKVRLSSYAATLSPEDDGHGRPRYVKYVDGLVRGVWVDVQLAEIRVGDAMFKEEPIETARLAPYMRAEQEAMHDGYGMWGNTARCSSNYDQGAQFQSWIVWKTNGPDDSQTAHEESFDVKNIGSTTVDLSHWKIRDSSKRFGGGTSSADGDQRTYMVLPAGTMLAPGKTLVIHPSHGTSDPSDDIFYNNGHDFQGDTEAFFANAPMAHGGRGAHPSRGAPYGGQLFLLDPAEDFRAWAAYPCVYKCGMPPPLKVSVSPGTDSQGRRLIRITNHARDDAQLTGDVVDFAGRVMNLGGTLPPGKTLTIHCQGHGQATSSSRYWNDLDRSLPRRGGTVWLRTASDVTISKYTWGNRGRYDYYAP